MNEEAIPILLSTAVGLAFIHTLIGIDHSLPFVVLARAQRWTMRRLMAVTALCGLGHVLGSILLGAIGISLGVALERLEWIEGVRGELAAWLLIAFGLTYAAWSAIRQLRNKQHSHTHLHLDGVEHAHPHDHQGEHVHAHAVVSQGQPEGSRGVERGLVTTWTLFIVFVFGPCEALIPLLMAPAWAHAWWVVVAVALLFGLVTIGTMMATVALAFRGLQLASVQRLGLERWADTAAGLAIAVSGLAITLLGL